MNNGCSFYTVEANAAGTPLVANEHEGTAYVAVKADADNAATVYVGKTAAGFPLAAGEQWGPYPVSNVPTLKLFGGSGDYGYVTIIHA